RRARGRRRAPRRARAGAGGVLPRRTPLRMGGLFRGRRDIRAAGPLLEVLKSVGLVDHHAHGILRERPTLDEFRGPFSESPDPRQWPHVATGLTYRRAMRELAAFFGCEPSEAAVYEHRVQADPAEYASALLRATG